MKNKDYILRQIEADREQRRNMREEQLLYKKNHFGPEETHDVIEDMTYENRRMTHTMNNNLVAQIKHRKEQKESDEAHAK